MDWQKIVTPNSLDKCLFFRKRHREIVEEKGVTPVGDVGVFDVGLYRNMRTHKLFPLTNNPYPWWLEVNGGGVAGGVIDIRY